MVRVVSMMVALLVAGCARTVELDRPFSLGVGEAVRVGSVSVLLTELLEDSRCPIDVQCIWEGRTRFALAASVRGERFDDELQLPGEAIEVRGYTIELLEVQPERRVGSIPEERYSARVIVRPVD